jgi:Ser/Thr protein kinase RdoA (MazF antagonist)
VSWGLPPPVLEAFGIAGAVIEPIAIGLVNRTYRVCDGVEPRLILQRLHPIFAGEVNEDIDAITAYLAHQGLRTPRLVRTLAGARWVEHEGIWRALTYLPGETRTELSDPAAARSAGALVGRFHRALADLDHTFAFRRAGVHDTARHLARLERALATPGPLADAVRPIAEAILDHARRLDPLPATRRRIVHGDLKISNLLWDERNEASAIVDLDTLGHGILAHEIGDALRSWCNPRGESDAAAYVDEALFEAALVGWGGVMRSSLDREEIESLALGLETIALELAARFALDAIEDCYFGWDPSRFPDRPAHNRARAASQLALARDARARRAALEAIVRRTLGGASPPDG